MSTKERLHQVVDELSDEEAEGMLRRIEILRTDAFVQFQVQGDERAG